MSKIKVDNWKEFYIYDLFKTSNVGQKKQVPTGANINQKYLKPGNTPRITVTNFNNGISGYYDDLLDNKDYRVYDNFISVSFLRTIFYHPYKASIDMKVHCLQLKDRELNDSLGKYLVTSIKAVLNESSFADQISSTVLPNIKIKLPVKDNGKPDWEYMEQYMKNIEEYSQKSIEKLLNTELKYHNIDTTAWKRFHLYDDELFEIDAGNKLDKSKMSTQNAQIAFVGRSSVNNGITAVVDEIKTIQPYKKGNLTISLGGEHLGSCFIQECDFYTSQNVNVLIPKWDMPFYCKLFLSSVIYKESRTYYKAFIDELNRHIKKDFSILLPVKDNGKPDWEYMEQYMKNIVEHVEEKINCLSV